MLDAKIQDGIQALLSKLLDVYTNNRIGGNTHSNICNTLSGGVFTLGDLRGSFYE